jgi:hypothetical protein
MNAGSLTAEQAMLVEATAQATAERVVELLSAREPVVAPRRLLSAAELADELGVARSFVYEHADEFGAVRLGEGSKPLLRCPAQKAGGRRANRPVVTGDLGPVVVAVGVVCHLVCRNRGRCSPSAAKRRDHEIAPRRSRRDPPAPGQGLAGPAAP